MKIKHLNFELNLEGNGIVNFDSKDQKYLWNRESKEGNKNVFSSVDNNNMYAKKVFFRDEEGKLGYKIKISSDAIRNAIFKSDAIATNPSIMHHKSLLNSFIGSTMGLTRGYMFAGDETYKRKSPLTVGSAIQSNNAISYMEFHGRSGSKKVGDDSEKSDTSIFNKETVGDITYTTKGFINIQELQFLSCDPIFDRFSFNSDDYSILKTVLNNTLPNFDNELGYYSLSTSAINVSEYGVKFNNEQSVYLIKELLKRIISINISKATAYAKFQSLKIELVTDVCNPANNKSIEIKSIDDINALEFDIEDFYVLADESEAKKQRVHIEETIKANTKKEADKKKSKKENN